VCSFKRHFIGCPLKYSSRCSSACNIGCKQKCSYAVRILVICIQSFDDNGVEDFSTERQFDADSYKKRQNEIYIEHPY